MDPPDVAVTNLDNDATFTLNHINRAWYRDDGVNAGNFTNSWTGWQSPNEYNSYFSYDLSGVSGTTVLNAILRTEIESDSGVDASETVAIWDVTTAYATLTAGSGGTAAYNDMMSGVQYGSFVVLSGDVGTVPVTTLNASARTDILGALGTNFSLGFHVSTLGKAVSLEGVRFSSGGEARIHQLILLVEQ